MPCQQRLKGTSAGAFGTNWSLAVFGRGRRPRALPIGGQTGTAGAVGCQRASISGTWRANAYINVKMETWFFSLLGPSRAKLCRTCAMRPRSSRLLPKRSFCPDGYPVYLAEAAGRERSQLNLPVATTPHRMANPLGYRLLSRLQQHCWTLCFDRDRSMVKTIF